MVSARAQRTHDENDDDGRLVSRAVVRAAPAAGSGSQLCTNGVLSFASPSVRQSWARLSEHRLLPTRAGPGAGAGPGAAAGAAAAAVEPEPEPESVCRGCQSHGVRG